MATAGSSDRVTALLLRVLPVRDADPPDAATVRKQFRAFAPFTYYGGAGRAGGVEDLVLDDGLRARLYRPKASGLVPTIVFFHGGGWVVGDVTTYDSQCRRLRDWVGAAVLSIEYRLAPEVQFPVPVDDCIAATRWAVRNVARLGGDAARIAVAGDSAGGNMAAVVAQTMRDEGIALRAQLLLYPATDSVGLRSGEASQRFPSHETYGTGYFLTLSRMQWYADRYIPNEADRATAKASPLRAESLAGLAPAIVATAGLDPLLDEGRAYAAALRAAGTPVTYLEFPGLIHGFFAIASLGGRSRSAAAACCAELKRLLA